MAKSKKKFKKQSGPPKPKDKTIDLIKKDKNGCMLAYPSLLAPDYEDVLKSPDAIVYTGETMKLSTPFAMKQKANIDKVHAAKDNPAMQIKLISGFEDNVVEPMKKLICTACSRFMSDIKDFDQALNIYDDAEKPVFDVLDFREHTKESYKTNLDILRQTADIVSAPEFEYDPSWTWSTSQYFNIVFTDNLMYSCKRILYDADNHAARYFCVEYRTFRINETKTIKIPTLWFIFFVSDIIVDAENMTYTHAPNMAPTGTMTDSDNWDFKAYCEGRYNDDGLGGAMLRLYAERYGNTFNALRINLAGKSTTLVEMLYHLDTDKRHYSTSDYKTIQSAVNTIIHTDIYSGFQTASAHFVENFHRIIAASLVSSALLITNKRLKEKKLSKPVAETAGRTVTYKAGDAVENRPERKTRILGDTIKITSEQRPEIPSMDKIIKYHIPEWNRKEHLRRLKSGKIVKVKASTCSRKCVNMNSSESKLPRQGVDYKIARKDPLS